jgi:hypothetical protein
MLIEDHNKTRERNMSYQAVSNEPTPYRVICYYNSLGGTGCGGSFLTYEEYSRQMNRPDATWQCPKCGSYDASWDDDNYEEKMGSPDDRMFEEGEDIVV